MKTAHIFYFLCALFVTTIQSQTNVSGALSSDTTWSLSNSPYTVTGNVLVLDEVTLTIEAGVVIKLQNNVGIVVNGTLIANGNETNRIIFTSDIADPQPGDWANIKFTSSAMPSSWDISENYSSGSYINYCDFKYAGNSSIYSEVSVFIHNSNFVGSEMLIINYYMKLIDEVKKKF